MQDRTQIEAEIRRVLAIETSAIRLSNTLFTPGGLFSKLFTTPAEKKAVIDSPLFDEAQKRLSELQRQEASRLQRPAQPLVVSMLGGPAVEQVQPTESAP